MKALRKIHLYLGCLFAPMIILFAVSGSLQVFDLHMSKKDGSYSAPPIIKMITNIHMHQRLAHQKEKDEESSNRMKFFVLLMGLGLTTTTILGIVMAFQMIKSRLIVWICLILGIVVPIFLLMSQ